VNTWETCPYDDWLESITLEDGTVVDMCNVCFTMDGQEFCDQILNSWIGVNYVNA
jgi:hypothetical protein